MTAPHVRIYHNPRCTKSREALALLHERGIEPEVILYLESGLTLDALRQLSTQLGLAPNDFVRTREEAYTGAQLDADSPAEEVFQAMVKAPILLERPIVIVAERGVVARPASKLLDLL